MVYLKSVMKNTPKKFTIAADKEKLNNYLKKIGSFGGFNYGRFGKGRTLPSKSRKQSFISGTYDLDSFESE